VVQVTEPRPAAAVDSAEFRHRLLGRLELFSGLTAPELRKLAEHCRHQAYGHEEVIVQQGDQSSEMFVVERGQVRIEALLQGSLEPHVISVLGRGEFFGEMSMLTGEARAASVIATTETEVLVLERDRFAPILEENPALAERISQVLTDRRKRLREALGTSPAAGPSNPAEQDELLKRIRRFFSLS
jgi:CRP-like cAMP-binding protein